MLKLILVMTAVLSLAPPASAQHNKDLIGQWKVVRTATSRLPKMTPEEITRLEGTVLMTITATTFDCPIATSFAYDFTGRAAIAPDEQDSFNGICLKLACDSHSWTTISLGADHDAIDFWLSSQGQLIFVYDGVYFLLERQQPAGH